jgi:hypothetical protein
MSNEENIYEISVILFKTYVLLAIDSVNEENRYMKSMKMKI